MSHYASPTITDPCALCPAPATHAIGEVLTWDHPELLSRREHRASVCCDCFVRLFPAARAECSREPDRVGHFQI